MKIRLFFSICFWAITLTYGFGRDTLYLKEVKANHFLTREFIEVVEDPYHKWTIDQISSPEFNKLFSTLKTEFPENEHPGSAYWIKFTVQNKEPEMKWVFECYNFKVRFVELYIPDEKGNYHLQRSGSGLNFKERTLQHKNLDFLLPTRIKQPTTFYVKFISYDAVRIRFNIRSYEEFTSYALNEYFLLGIFYGMIIIIVLYNFFLFLRLQDEAYLYYALYAVFVGAFSMVQDGTGFQYLWPNFPEFNPYALFFCSAVMIICMIMYTKSFLETELRLPLMNRILNWAIILRILLFFVQIFLLSEFNNYIWVDIIPYLLVYLAAIIAYKRKNSSALFFVLGFSVLFLGFTVNTLRIYKMIPSTILTAYSINIVVIIEMLLLSMALAERVKKIRENELIKENLNRELELKVKERTEALMIQNKVIEEKVQTLDTFIYKASHDIKGPLKSLIGITDLGLKDTKENAHIYFEHALKTAKKLDAIIKDLLHITKVNNANIELSEIDFKISAMEALDNLRKLPGYEKVTFELDIKQEGEFLSEKNIIYSLFQNFIENGIKYRNPKVKKSFLKIKVKADSHTAEIKFTDNGIGISPEHQDKIFDMFFRVEAQADDSTGLGLYIVKLSVEKLGGQIFLQSKLGEGSSFTILLQNMRKATF